MFYFNNVCHLSPIHKPLTNCIAAIIEYRHIGGKLILYDIKTVNLKI